VEKMKLRQELKARTDELEETISHYSVEIGKLNTIIVELEKNKTVIAKLESENAEFRDRIMKVEQRQMLSDNVSKVINSSNNSSPNFNSLADQLPMEMDTSLPEEPIPEGLPELAVNIPKNNDDNIEFTKSQVVEQELTKELLSSIISAPLISFDATEQIPSINAPLISAKVTTSHTFNSKNKISILSNSSPENDQDLKLPEVKVNTFTKDTEDEDDNKESSNDDNSDDEGSFNNNKDDREFCGFSDNEDERYYYNLNTGEIYRKSDHLISAFNNRYFMFVSVSKK
ncbi:32919_t:CDS:2, partial [Racocetra persica]